MKARVINHKESDEYKAIRHVLDTLGLMIIGVQPEKKHKAFYYTIGMHEKHGLPELLIIGNFQEQVLTDILQKLANTMAQRGTMYVDGARVNMGGKYPLL